MLNKKFFGGSIFFVSCVVVAAFAIVAAMGLGVKAHSVDATIAAVDVLERGNDAVLESVYSVGSSSENDRDSVAVDVFEMDRVGVNLPAESEPAIFVEDVNEVVYATTITYVRSGPGGDCDRVDVLKCGEAVELTGVANNGWSRVSWDGQAAYVRSEYLGEFFVEDASGILYATTDVNVRTGPGVDYESVAVLKRGEAVELTGITNNGWSRVNWDGQAAYVRSKYLGEFFVEDAYDVLYATADVNVRTGPGVDYESVAVLKCGEAVELTGITNNGWSRVNWDGQAAYVRSKYLGDCQPFEDYDQSYEDCDQSYEANKGGKSSFARLTIPSVGVDVALYTCSMNSNYLSVQQGIVDADDSAAYLYSNAINGNIIADHASQGFDNMKASIPYETYAYIDCGYEVREYVCVGIGEGHNYCSDLVDWNGDSLHRGDITGGLAMYTCNDETGLSVTISYWEPV